MFTVWLIYRTAQMQVTTLSREESLISRGESSPTQERRASSLELRPTSRDTEVSKNLQSSDASRVVYD